MTEPTTEAGRALAEALPRFFRAHAYWRDFEPSVPDRIRRIEAEAEAAERERIRAAVERLPVWSPPSGQHGSPAADLYWWMVVSLDAVFAAIDEAAP